MVCSFCGLWLNGYCLNFKLLVMLKLVMEKDMLNSFGNLQYELDEAKKCLKTVDDNIKKLIGRDPSDLTRINKKKIPSNDDGPGGLKIINRGRNITYDTDAPLKKRRNIDFESKRISAAIIPEDTHQELQKQIISKVIVTSKEIPSREDVLEAQNKDEKFRARNKRMFGALLGTLQKFQQEETKLRPREEKRAQLERKIEEHDIKEKEEVKRERHELFLNRKKTQLDIKIIELKMCKMKEYTAWEESQKPRENFILTKTSPQIHYLPRRLNNKTKDLLYATKQDIQTIIEKKSQQILEELQYIGDKMKRNFNNKYGIKNIKQNEDTHSNDDDDVEKVIPELMEDVIDESNKDEGNVIGELTQFSSLGKEYDNGIQDKENKQSIDSRETTFPQDDVKSKEL